MKCTLKYHSLDEMHTKLCTEGSSSGLLQATSGHGNQSVSRQTGPTYHSSYTCNTMCPLTNELSSACTYAQA